MSEENKVDLNYASMGEMVVTTKTSSNTTYSQDDITSYLSNPFTYHQQLRAVSDYFYYSDGIYKNVINTFANLPTLDNMVLPTQKTLQKATDKSYNNYYDKVNAYVESIGLKPTIRKMLRSVAKYGGFVGYERTDGNDVYIQTLPLDYCRVSYKVGHEYQIEFNFKYFDKFFSNDDLVFAFTGYAKEFEKLYNTYKSDRKSKNPEWQPLDIKKTFCIMFEEDDGFFIPIYSGLFQALLDNYDIHTISKLGQQIETQKILVQKIPLTKENTISLPKEQVQYLHEQLKRVIPENVNGLTTPLEVTDVSFTNTSKQKEDLLEKAERNVFINSGMSSALFADNNNSVGLNMNIELITANIFAVIEKIEEMFNIKLNNVANSKNYTFKLQIFRTTNINIKENFERAYQLLSIGGAIQPLFALTGFDVETYSTLLQVESMLGIKDYLVVPQSMHTMNNSSPSDNQSGASQKSDTEISDSGLKTRQADSNNPKNRVS